MSRKKISIFCQAPGDIIHVLAIYQEHCSESRISIYCVNVKPIYDYLLSLKLEVVNLEFIPYDFKFSPTNPFSIIVARKKLKKIHKTLFANKKNETVYFFAIWFDWISFFLVNKLTNNNNVIYYEHYKSVPEKGKEKYNIKEKYILTLYYWVTGLKLQYTKDDAIKRLLFLYQDKNIKKQSALEIKPELFSPYLYQVENIQDKSVLLIETELTGYDIFSDYQSEMRQIINTLQKKGYIIYIKGHPSLGTTKEIEDICNYIIPKHIPAELIDTSQFHKFIGIQSFSLVYFSNISDSVFSIIELLSFNKKSQKNMYLEYLNSNSNKKIKFPKNISEICL